MDQFRILHERRTPPGLECKLLKKMHWAVLAATLAPLLLAVSARVFSNDPYAPGAAKALASVDIFCIAVAITLCTAIFTVAIGCVVVHIMKGPAYLADSLEVEPKKNP